MIKKNEIKTHLEYFNYEVLEEAEEYIIFQKTSFPFLLVNADELGIKFYAKYNFNEIAKDNKVDVLEYINKLNLDSRVTKFALDDKNNSIEFTANRIGKYSKKEFSLLIEFWEYDTSTVFQNHAETDIFFGNDNDRIDKEELSIHA